MKGEIKTMVGTSIKKIREQRNIPQSILAIKTGLKQCQISKIENGARKVSAEELDIIAKALNVSVKKLFESA
jgi:transcriptional regulator with XRE-family HTH domain